MSLNENEAARPTLPIRKYKRPLVHFPSHHPFTGQPVAFNTSISAEYPRNSYNTALPPEYKPGECWWPDGLNELDPRPRVQSQKWQTITVPNRFQHAVRPIFKWLFTPIDPDDGDETVRPEVLYQANRSHERQLKAQAPVERKVKGAITAKKSLKEVKAFANKISEEEVQKELQQIKKANRKIDWMINWTTWSKEDKAHARASLVDDELDTEDWTGMSEVNVEQIYQGRQMYAKIGDVKAGPIRGSLETRFA